MAHVNPGRVPKSWTGWVDSILAVLVSGIFFFLFHRSDLTVYRRAVSPHTPLSAQLCMKKKHEKHLVPPTLCVFR